jgi:hypothetical protein
VKDTVTGAADDAQDKAGDLGRQGRENLSYAQQQAEDALGGAGDKAKVGGGGVWEAAIVATAAAVVPAAAALRRTCWLGCGMPAPIPAAWRMGQGVSPLSQPLPARQSV